MFKKLVCLTKDCFLIIYIYFVFLTEKPLTDFKLKYITIKNKLKKLIIRTVSTVITGTWLYKKKYKIKKSADITVVKDL